MTTSASTGTNGGPPYKRSVKNYLIDSRFQLKYTGLIVAVTVVISGVLGAFLWRTSRELVGESQVLASQGQQLIDQSQQLINESKKVSEVTKMNIKSLGYDDPSLTADFTKEADEYDKQVELKQQTLIKQQDDLVKQQASIVRQQGTMMYAVVGGLALMVLLIAMFGIYFTHKVAGPIFKMKRLLKQVGDGNLAVDARLRKGDELQDFFETFASMVESLRARQKREVDDLDGAVTAARDAGASAESIARVERVRDELKRGLEA
jgi:nitrogen fixation/metabolism regulation signal transduction histidine kinase